LLLPRDACPASFGRVVYKRGRAQVPHLAVAEFEAGLHELPEANRAAELRGAEGAGEAGNPHRRASLHQRGDGEVVVSTVPIWPHDQIVRIRGIRDEQNLFFPGGTIGRPRNLSDVRVGLGLETGASVVSIGEKRADWPFDFDFQPECWRGDLLGGRGPLPGRQRRSVSAAQGKGPGPGLFDREGIGRCFDGYRPVRGNSDLVLGAAGADIARRGRSLKLARRVGHRLDPGPRLPGLLGKRNDRAAARDSIEAFDGDGGTGIELRRRAVKERDRCVPGCAGPHLIVHSERGVGAGGCETRAAAVAAADLQVALQHHQSRLVDERECSGRLPEMEDSERASPTDEDDNDKDEGQKAPPILRHPPCPSHARSLSAIRSVSQARDSSTSPTRI